MSPGPRDIASDAPGEELVEQDAQVVLADGFAWDGLPEAMVTDIEELLSSWPSTRIGPRHVEVFTELFTELPHPDVHRRSCD